jgi:hypothetical protein
MEEERENIKRDRDKGKPDFWIKEEFEDVFWIFDTVLIAARFYDPQIWVGGH